MRSAHGLPLALLLAGSTAFAGIVVPMEPPEVQEQASNADGTLLYNFSQRPRVDVADGDIRVTAENTTAAPPWGSGLLRVYVENRGRRPERVELRFGQRGTEFADVRRVIETQPGRTELVTLIIPSGMSYGTLSAEASGITEGGLTQISFVRGNAAILAVGTDEKFKSVAGSEPDTSSYGLLVRSIAADELPTELAAYTGYGEVVVLSPFSEIPEGPRRALEAWTATGGTLVLTRSPRGAAQYLPLLGTSEPGLHPYAFGHVRICDGDAGECASTLEADLHLASPAVRAMAGGQRSVPAFDQDGNRIPDSEMFLLPQAVAPVGRFLLVILAFTLAIGPGSVWIARKKGPPMLLLTIPATAGVACLLIVGWSVLVDGFSVHAAMRGYTLLDRSNDRAITLGLQAFYANVAPGEVTLDGDTALLPPSSPSYAVQNASTDWTNGQVIGADFLPSRTYREWGVAAVRPSRARLVARPEGNEVVVENALGSDLREAWIQHEGRTYVVRQLADGDRGRAVEGAWEPEHFGGANRTRFDTRVSVRALRGLEDGEFVAWVDGPGPLPFGDLRLTHHSSGHVIRGEVDR